MWVCVVHLCGGVCRGVLCMCVVVCVGGCCACVHYIYIIIVVAADTPIFSLTTEHYYLLLQGILHHNIGSPTIRSS